MKTYDLDELKRELVRINLQSDKMVYSKNDFAIFRNIHDIDVVLTPTRMQMAVFGLCQTGSCDIIVDTKTYHLTAGDYIVLLPGQVVQFLPKTISEDMQGIFICISQAVYNEMFQRVQNTLPLFLFMREHPTAHLQEAEVEWVTQYHQLIFQEMQNTDNFFRSDIARTLMLALLYKVCNIYSAIVHAQSKARNRQEEIFTQFVTLLREHYMEERSLSYYADIMCITPKYLGTTIKTVSGENANQWISSFVVKEAKILLQTTHLNIQQISDRLHFPSQSFFGKYFKQHTGMSPQHFRKTMRNAS